MITAEHKSVNFKNCFWKARILLAQDRRHLGIYFEEMPIPKDSIEGYVFVNKLSRIIQ